MDFGTPIVRLDKVVGLYVPKREVTPVTLQLDWWHKGHSSNFDKCNVLLWPFDVRRSIVHRKAVMKQVTGNQNAASAEMFFELKWVAIPRKSQEHDFVWYNS